MSHIKLVRSEQRKDLPLQRVGVSIDPIVLDALHERLTTIKEEHGLQQYGIGNYILSLALHDPVTRKIVHRRRKEADANGGQRNYHRETEVGTDNQQR